MTPILHRARDLSVRFRLNEAGPLLTLAGLSLFAWAFVSVAGEVLEGDTEALDRALMLALRVPGDLSDPLGPSWLEEAARDITGLGGNAVLTLLTLACAVYLWMTGKNRAALLLLAAVGGGTVLSLALKSGFERPRPDLVPHGARVYTASFPSGHAMISAVTYLTLGALLARTEARRAVRGFLLGLAVTLTLLIGLSRVYLGVHWPSDVLAGWCGGAAWAALCWFVELQLQRTGQVERAGAPAGAAGPS